ncbi:mitochondrial carrier domain-containing protein [Chytridium lagenaria]|nr:mitochondrial carrier domain-containing protein [Chytridium lagenaria]
MPTQGIASTHDHPLPTIPTVDAKRKDKRSWEYIVKSLVAGGVAGCAAKTSIAPLDRVKILFQTNNPHFEKYSGEVLRMVGLWLRWGLEEWRLGAWEGCNTIGLGLMGSKGDDRLVEVSSTFLDGVETDTIPPFFYDLENDVKPRITKKHHGLSFSHRFTTPPPQLGTFFGVFRAIRDIGSENGVRGLFQGHSATLLRIFPYAAIKFMAYEQYKEWLMPNKKEETAVNRFVAGSLAGVTSVFFSYPFDILRTRLAFEVRSATSTSGLLSTATTMLREPHPYHFGFFNFYRGFLPTIYGMIPYAGVSFLSYESIKVWALEQEGWTEHARNKRGEKQLRWWSQLLVGGSSGALAQTASYPFEVIRRQMQVAGKTVATAGAKATYPGTWSTAKTIFKRKGMGGFFVGLSIGYLKITPMFAVSFFVYEYMKDIFRID